jgi:hypothetical protein
MRWAMFSVQSPDQSKSPICILSSFRAVSPFGACP